MNKKMNLRIFFIAVLIIGYYPVFAQNIKPRQHPLPKVERTRTMAMNHIPPDNSGYVPFFKEFVPTFESISYYYPCNYNNAKCNVSFRKFGEYEWHTAFSPFIDKNLFNYRGSIVNLRENTEYEIRAVFYFGGSVIQEELDTVKTWAEVVPIKTVYSIHDFASNDYRIDVSGTSDGWIKITGDQQVVDGAVLREAAIKIHGQHHLILEDIVISGGLKYGIDLQNSQNIRIINCDISGWGKREKHVYFPEGTGRYNDGEGSKIVNDAGISLQGNEKIVIEKCFIHDPQGRANPWYYGHPEGPAAIWIDSKNTEGNYVIRYNDFSGSEAHRWNDAVQGRRNLSQDGSFFRDSDIYGNLFSMANDDGIELDGGQMNVRVYGNKFLHILCGISTAPNIIGPSYIFRNVITNLGDETGRAGSMIKNGGGRTNSLGRAYFLHNTFASKGNGIKAVGSGFEEDRQGFFGFSRNNILMVLDKGNAPIMDVLKYPEQDFDYDLMWDASGDPVKIIGKKGIEKNGIIKNPDFVSVSQHRFDVKKGSPAIDTGSEIDNFSANYNGHSPDMGAFEFGKNNFIPYRPVQIFPDKSMVEILDNYDTPVNKIPVKVNCENLNESERYFKVKKNFVYEWLVVDPSEGVLPSNGEMQFDVSIDKDKRPYSFSEFASFFVKLSNGYSIPIMIRAELKDGLSKDISIPVGEKLSNSNLFIHEFTIDKKGMYYIYVQAKKTNNGKSDVALGISINQGKMELRYKPDLVKQNKLEGWMINKPVEKYPHTMLKVEKESRWYRVKAVSGALGKSTAHRLFLHEGVNLITLRKSDDVLIENILISSNPFNVSD